MRRFSILFCAILLLAGCDKSPAIPAESNPVDMGITDVVVGRGDGAANGDTATIFYVGKFKDGKVFQSTYDDNQPYKFVVGSDDVLLGLSKGLIGMKVGGKRHLVIPSDMGYGENGSAAGANHVPPNTTLYFDVELLSLKHPAQS